MATLRQKIELETKMRELLRKEGMPQPDAVEYGHECIRLFFEEPKIALVVEVDHPPVEDGTGEPCDRGTSAEIWARDQRLYDAEARQDDGGYDPGMWEPYDAELN